MQKLTPARATTFIREKFPDLHLHWTGHAKDQLAERSLIMGDGLHVLKYGFVHEDPVPATQHDLWKYKIECVTPNSGSRTVRLVVIPFPDNGLKIITVMWADEHLTGG